LPCIKLTVLEAGESDSVGGDNETVNGRFTLAVATEPLFCAIFAVNPSVAGPAATAELPVSVSVHATAPAEVTDAAPQLAATPFGRPEATLMLEPLAPLDTTAPPAGVAVTVIDVVPNDCIDADTGEAVSVKLGAGVTWSVTLLVAERPSPAAVTINVELPKGDEAPAIKVRVALANPDAGLTGFADHVAVTPLGMPLRLRLTFPANDPPVSTAKLSGALAPCAIATVLDAAFKDSVGGALIVSA